MATKYLKRTVSSRYIPRALEYLSQPMFLIRSLLASTVALVVCVAPAIAQDEKVHNEKNTNGFFPAKTKWFEEGDATTVFSKEPAKSDSPEVGFYKEREEKIEEAEAELQPAVAGKSAKPPFDTRTATPEQILNYYGDPGAEPALLPEDNAPMPFKAMGAALDSGNSELAFKYARQYVRYLSGTMKRVDTVTKLTDLAMEREGVRPAVEKNNPYAYLLEEDLQEAEDTGSESQSKDKKLSKLIHQAAEAEGVDLKALKQVPVDKGGQVDVLFFFNPIDNKSMQMAQEVQKLQQQFGSDESVKITAFSLANADKIALSRYALQRGLTFPIQPGQAVGANLAVQNSPTVIFIARNSQKMYRLEDFHKVSELSKVVSHMKGGPNA